MTRKSLREKELERRRKLGLKQNKDKLPYDVSEKARLEEQKNLRRWRGVPKKQCMSIHEKDASDPAWGYSARLPCRGMGTTMRITKRKAFPDKQGDGQNHG